MHSFHIPADSLVYHMCICLFSYYFMVLQSDTGLDYICCGLSSNYFSGEPCSLLLKDGIRKQIWDLISVYFHWVELEKLEQNIDPTT